MTMCELVAKIVFVAASMHQHGFTQAQAREYFHAVPDRVIDPILINEYGGTTVVPVERRALAAKLACETQDLPAIPTHYHWNRW